MIYLDNAATTKMFEKGVDIYKEYACHSFFNPSATYSFEISQKLDCVRKDLLNTLCAAQGDVIFTSGATESNNLAILGSVRNNKNSEYVCSMGEHPSVFNVYKELQNRGFVVHFVELDKNGQIDKEELKKVLNQNTRLVSCMHVSNETGAINDLKGIKKLLTELAPNALFHVDGVQAFCKFDVNVKEVGCDFYSMSAHKFHGPKGVGVLYVKNKSALKNLVYGGGQEGGTRSGTENVAGIMAMDYAIKNIDIKQNYQKVLGLYNIFVQKMQTNENISIFKTENPYVVSVSFKGINGETLARILQENEIIVGKGSACSSKKAGNRILKSIGKSEEEIKSSLRVSFDYGLDESEVEKACDTILAEYIKLWEKVK